jgi:hypothetical protein
MSSRLRSTMSCFRFVNYGYSIPLCTSRRESLSDKSSGLSYSYLLGNILLIKCQERLLFAQRRSANGRSIRRRNGFARLFPRFPFAFTCNRPILRLNSLGSSGAVKKFSGPESGFFRVYPDSHVLLHVLSSE